MYQYFRISLWILLILIVGLLSFFVASIEKMTKSNFPFGDSVMVVVSGLVGGSFEGSLTKSLVMDITVLFWRVGSLLIVTYCNAGLTTLMNLPRFTSDVKTFDDMINMKIRWFFKIAGMRGIVLSYGGIYAKMAQLFEQSNNSTYVNSKIKTGRYGIIVESLPGRLLANIDMLDSYSRRNLKIIDECFIKNYVVFHTQLNSPYFEYINSRINLVVASGLVDILMSDVVDQQEKKVSTMFYSPYSGEIVQILNLSRLQGAFWMLFLGWVVASIMFLWKIGSKHLKGVGD